MDFHGLSRKDLQTLCKKNKIPANMTNIAMADALTALANVEGIEEIGGPEKAQPVPDSPYTCGRASTRRRASKDQVVLIQNEQESGRLVSRTRGRPRKIIEDDEQDGKDPKDLSQDSSIPVPVPESPHTGLRSSTRRRPISRNTDVSIENNFESSKPLTQTRCRTRRGNEEEKEQVDKDLGDLMENPSGAVNPKTPAARNGRRRTGASAVKVNETNKKEDEEEEEKDEKTKHIVTRVYSTRRSARLQRSEANLNTERRTKAVHITSLSEEENEESAPVKDELEKVSGDNNAKIFALNSCDSDVCVLQEDLAPKDASAVVIPVEDSYDASIVPKQSTCEENLKVENLIADLLEQDSATEISGITDLVPDQMMMQENPHCLETEKPNLPASIVNGADIVSKQLTVEKTPQDNESEADDSNASKDYPIEEDASDVSKQLTVEKTHNLQDNESEADDSNASKDYLIEEDASDPVISAHLLHNNVEPAAERSENVKFECIGVEEPESQIAGKTELCKEEEASCEFPSSCSGETLRDEIPEESSSEDLDNEMVVSEITERSSCLTNDPDEEVESTGDFEGGDNEELGLHADGSGEIAPSLSEVWDFGLLKDSIQECLNGLESEKCNSDSVPLDIEVLGKVESGHEALSHLDFNSTEITGWLNCQSPEEAEPLDDKMVPPENPDVAMELSALADDKMKNQEFEQILDVISDANSVPMAKILCSGESNMEELNKGVSDEITVSSGAVPSLLSPCRGLISESGYLLNQVKLTPSKSSTKKKTATPSQGKALIMVLDENKDRKGNHSGGLSLRKKSNSKTLASATDEKENMNISNYSGGLSLRNKSNSKVTLSIAEEKENDNKFEDSIQQTLKNTSLRQLKKMFKEKLLITDNNKSNNTDKEHQQVEKSRAALQTLTDNNSLMGNREN